MPRIDGQGQGRASSGEGRKGRERKYAVLATRTFAVLNREGSFTAPQVGVVPQHFHTREHESECSGCHRLDAEPQDRDPAKPEQVLGHACHRDIPTGKHIHGPAAVGNCLGCHDPNLSPHSAETPELLACGVRTTVDLCNICHPKK